MTALAEQVDAIKAQRIDDHDGPIIVIAIGRRASSQTGVGCLADDNNVSFDAGLQHPPLLEQSAGSNHGEHFPVAEAITLAEATCLPVTDQDMPMSDELLEFGKERLHDPRPVPAGAVGHLPKYD